MQSRAEQSRAEQSRAEQSRAEQSRAERRSANLSARVHLSLRVADRVRRGPKARIRPDAVLY